MKDITISQYHKQKLPYIKVACIFKILLPSPLKKRKKKKTELYTTQFASDHPAVELMPYREVGQASPRRSTHA
jgi:hypothetical protein